MVGRPAAGPGRSARHRGTDHRCSVPSTAPRDICPAKGLLRMTYELVLRAGRVIDPSQSIDRVGDVAFAGGRVAAVGDDLAPQAQKVVEVAGTIVTPGLIDLHT